MPIPILMPALSPTMTEGKLAKWLKKEGEAIASGDLIAEIETDKATMEVEATDEGTLGKILVQDGTEGVAVNTQIGLILEEGEDQSALDGAVAATPNPAPKAEAPKPQSKPEPQPTARPEPAAAPSNAKASGRVFASPLARRLAEEAGIDLTAITGSGPHGRIVKADIAGAPPGGLPAIQAPAPVPSLAPGAVGSYTEIPNSTMRKVIGQRLSDAKRDVPHYYLTVDCMIDDLLKLRADLNSRSPEGAGAYKLSVNDFIVRAVALAMRQVPGVNASWSDEAIRRYNSVDVSIAVATPGGLITPIVRSADNKGLASISNEVKELAGRAKEGKLQPEEYQGGGFTISNLGMFGIKHFTAIINPPQSAILAVGAGEQRPVVIEGALAVATIMTCTLSADHRSIDGALGAQFLATYKKLIEEPLTMLL
jgi:pyruvate dehydrogenase E2 component (dihydrolipoamide acetyltransferase)